MTQFLDGAKNRKWIDNPNQERKSRRFLTTQKYPAQLTRITLATIGQMERIPGITEGAISAVLFMMKKMEMTGQTIKGETMR